jgi:heme exporter protein B
MQLMKSIFYLIQKEITLELRQKYAISGIILYVFATVFIVYLSLRQVSPMTWNPLFWIIILFASVNALVKSFTQENSDRSLYYYTLAHPTAIIFSKIIYNFLLLSFLSLLTYGIFSVVTGHPVQDVRLFLLILFLGSLGFSITLTFISAIAAKASNSATLLAILGFPVIIPILITLIKLSASALKLLEDSSNWRDIVNLLAIDVILIALIFVLFPFLWRD